MALLCDLRPIDMLFLSRLFLVIVSARETRFLIGKLHRNSDCMFRCSSAS
jgi:hypothetical protein